MALFLELKNQRAFASGKLADRIALPSERWQPHRERDDEVLDKTCADLNSNEAIDPKLSDGSRATNQSEVREWTWMTLASAPFAMSLTGFVGVGGWKSDNVPILLKYIQDG